MLHVFSWTKFSILGKIPPQNILITANQSTLITLTRCFTKFILIKLIINIILLYE